MTPTENRLRVARIRAVPTTHWSDSSDREVCSRGHFFDFENTRVKSDGRRACKRCGFDKPHSEYLRRGKGGIS